MRGRGLFALSEIFHRLRTHSAVLALQQSGVSATFHRVLEMSGLQGRACPILSDPYSVKSVADLGTNPEEDISAAIMMVTIRNDVSGEHKALLLASFPALD